MAPRASVATGERSSNAKAQKAHRERKAAYLKSLERSKEELTLQVEALQADKDVMQRTITDLQAQLRSGAPRGSDARTTPPLSPSQAGPSQRGSPSRSSTEAAQVPPPQPLLRPSASRPSYSSAPHFAPSSLPRELSFAAHNGGQVRQPPFATPSVSSSEGLADSPREARHEPQLFGFDQASSAGLAMPSASASGPSSCAPSASTPMQFSLQLSVQLAALGLPPPSADMPLEAQTLMPLPHERGSFPAPQTAPTQACLDAPRPAGDPPMAVYDHFGRFLAASGNSAMPADHLMYGQHTAAFLESGRQHKAGSGSSRPRTDALGMFEYEDEAKPQLGLLADMPPPPPCSMSS